MSREPLDLTQPGPAGLYFRTDRLLPTALAEDRAARARLETHCAICGTLPAHYGFGRHTACDDPTCQAEAEARMHADRAPAPSLEPPREPAPLSPPSLDLFSVSEAA